jgi:uncharacterized membrane protein YtjA (UPF0391 family)
MPYGRHSDQQGPGRSPLHKVYWVLYPSETQQGVSIVLSGTNGRAQHDWGKDGMLRAALIFLLIAMVMAICGFTGIAGGATDIAKFLFFLFLAVFLFLFVMAILTGRSHF